MISCPCLPLVVIQVPIFTLPHMVSLWARKKSLHIFVTLYKMIFI